MKTLLFALLLAATQAHASNARGEAGHHGPGALGSQGAAHAAAVAAQSAANAAAQQGGSGGSLLDDYLPWDEASMRQFAKPKFTPFDGK